MKIKFLPVCFLFLWACTQNEESPKTQIEVTSENRDSILAALSSVDFSLEFNGKELQYSIVPISKEEYKSLKEVSVPKEDLITELRCGDDAEDCWKKIEKTNILPFADLVDRKGDTLILKCGADTNISYVNVNGADETEYVGYTFKHKYKNPDFYIVSVGYYEGGEYKIVNQKTCEELTVGGFPIFSPDRKKAVISVIDYMDGSALEVLTIQDSILKLDVSRGLEEWVAPNLFWISNNELKIVQEPMGYDDEGALKRYARFKIKE